MSHLNSIAFVTKHRLCALKHGVTTPSYKRIERTHATPQHKMPRCLKLYPACYAQYVDPDIALQISTVSLTCSSAVLYYYMCIWLISTVPLEYGLPFCRASQYKWRSLCNLHFLPTPTAFLRLKCLMID